MKHTSSACTDDRGQMSQALVQDSLIKNTMLPRKVASQITAKGQKKVVVTVWCILVAVCLTVNRSSMLTGSLYKPLYLASRAWISSTRASLHAKLCLAFSLPLSHTHKLTRQHRHTHSLYKRHNLASVVLEQSGRQQVILGSFLHFVVANKPRCKPDTLWLSHRKADSLCFPLLSSYKSSIKSVLSHSILSRSQV